jgi:Fic family protein
MLADQDGSGQTTGPAAWPSVGSEERAWSPTIPADLVSRAVRARHAGPYRAAVVAEIAELDPGLPSAVAALTAEASAEVARFDAELGVEIAPFAAVLLRSESASSSMIENLTSGAKAIALAELGSADKRNATEIVGNVRAMQAALELADRLDGDAVLAMHAALLGDLEPTRAGRWRAEQVWIGGDSFGPHGASFVPPHHDRVPAAMADLIRFVQRDDLPVLTQAAVAHAQFETIHPFTDGNGRTGRALIHSMLRAKGLTRRVTVPVSAGLLTDTGAYFDTLGAYRDGAVVPIVQAMANATFAAVTNGRQLVGELRAIRDAWNGTVRARRDSNAWRLADFVLRQPVIDLAAAARELGISPTNALRPIATLAEAGVLSEFTGFKRNRMWQSREVLSTLDDFAARAGPRGAG